MVDGLKWWLFVLVTVVNGVCLSWVTMVNGLKLCLFVLGDYGRWVKMVFVPR